jgi:hypothetical protein
MGGKKDACAESDENANYGAKKPRRKKGSEYIEGGRACFRATTQRQQRQRKHASVDRTSLDPALRPTVMLFRQIRECLTPG